DKLEQALARIKLMTTGTMSDMKILPSPPNRPGRITSPDVIYAEAGAEFGNKSTMININNSKKSQSLPARVLKKLMSRFSYD
ncbi:MAG TPA: hypothetical protein VLG38_04440, partial [Gammaproteobacteria bacterium]|nr:hypothetical protein [Gammaproteobacteria bacterium]